MAYYLIGMNLLISMPFFGVQYLWPGGKDLIAPVPMLAHFAMGWHFSSSWIQSPAHKDFLTAVTMYAFAFLGLLIYFKIGALLAS